MKYIIKIFSLSCLLISLILFSYTFYKSEIQWEGIKRSYYLVYYITTCILILFSFISFFLSQKIKEYLIIVGLTIFFTLYAFEFYYTFKFNVLADNKKIYKKITGKEFDPRNKLQIYNDLKKKNKNLTISIPPTSFLKEEENILPFSGVSKAKTIFCKENGYYAIYKSDRYGFNNPDKEWDKLEIEYLLLGDSFVQGACVNRPYDIASVLRSLSNKSVLNLGYASNGPLIEYSVLREYLNVKVKNVLWIFYEGNDLINLNNELANKILQNYLEDMNFSQNLKLKQNLIDNILKGYLENKEKRKKFQFSEFIKLYKLRSLFIPSPTQKPGPEFKKIIKLAKELTEANKANFYFVYLPTYNRYNSSFDDASYIEIKKILKELKIPLIDIHRDLFEKEKNPKNLFPFGLPGHYNIDGYNKTAKTIYNHIKLK